MLGLGRHKKQPIAIELDEDIAQSIFNLIDTYQNAVSGNAVQRLMNIDSTELDEYLQSLVNKRWIEVAYEKTGLDGVSRPYYRVSESYNLFDVKNRVSKFISDVIRKARPYVDNDHHYRVRVQTHKEFDMTFDRRQDARDYKRLLKESRMKLNSDIWEQVFEEGFQSKEKRVS